MLRMTMSVSGHQSGTGGEDQVSAPRALETARQARPHGRPGSVWAGWAAVSTWTYAALVLTMLGLIRWVGEGWWGVTVLLFIPRWVFLVPIAVLALASALPR